MYKILFVCTGNICRSPTAEAVMRRKADRLGLSNKIYIDSAATHGYNTGDAPHWQSVKVAEKKGYNFYQNQPARIFIPKDHEDFDLILGMTRQHVSHIQPGLFDKPKGEVTLFLEYAGLGQKDVPDPYGKEWKDFEHVLTMIEDGVDKILQKLSPKIH